MEIPHQIGEIRGLVEACKKRDDLLDLYLSADDPALIEILVKKIRDLQDYIDNAREH